jgi:ribosomal protein S18 acetylase RimI-like enzyme
MSARPHIVLRDADRDDAASLIALWSECVGSSRDDGSEAFTQQAMWREPGVAEAASALDLSLSRPEKRIIVAVVDDEIVGATVCDITTLTPISLSRILLVTDIQVSPRFRRRSVASTLLSAAASYGEEHNCEIVMAAIPVHSRECTAT